MRAAIFDAPQAIRMADVAKPAPGFGEVLVKVKAAGLCAGDLYIYTGKNPYVSYPRIGCHEISGVVEAYGPGASGPAVGTRVVVDPFIGCGKCYPCRIGKRNSCANLPIIGVHREVGVPGLVRAMEGADAEMHDADRLRVAVVIETRDLVRQQVQRRGRKPHRR